MRNLRRMCSAACFIGVFAMASAAQAEVKLASVFGDGMVIQRDRPIHVWGTAAANTAIQLHLDDHAATTKADGSGNWAATLDQIPAGGPHTLTVSDGGSTVTLQDVLGGDVWLCSGQSNMQMSLGECDDGAKVAAESSTHPKLRLCKIGLQATDAPHATADAKWESATPESAAHFTAVGYYFGNELLKDPALADVPIGLIQSAVGGTMAEAWAPKEALTGIDPAILENSMFGIKPTTLYNGMIYPLGQLALKGAIWYQGEGNAGHPESYPSKLTAVITGWRKQFKDPKLPFVIVELPDFMSDWGGYYWQWLRDAQHQVAAKVPNVMVSASINTNDGQDLHPKQKHEIGHRLAMLIRQDVYHEQVIGQGPVFKDAQPENDSIRVTFNTDGSTLTATDPNDVQGFMVAGDDGKYRKATAKIDGDAVVLKSDLVASPKTVRYAWAGVSHSTLTNTDGLPTDTFRTDKLPADTLGSQELMPARVVATKDYSITIINGGRLSSFIVQGKELLSNETGLSGGVCIPSFFGPQGFGKFESIGPDLVTIGNGQLQLLMNLEPQKVTWVISNKTKDGSQLHVALSPFVKASQPQGGVVTLSRPELSLKVTGVDHVSGDDRSKVLEFKLDANTTKTIEFQLNAH